MSRHNETRYKAVSYTHLVIKEGSIVAEYDTQQVKEQMIIDARM